MHSGPLRHAQCELRSDEDGCKHDMFNAVTCSVPAAVHPTTTKDSNVISLDMLADICAAVSIPVVAIGGMNAENCQPSIQAGCAGVAVVSAIFGVPDVVEAAAAIREKVDAALGV